MSFLGGEGLAEFVIQALGREIALLFGDPFMKPHVRSDGEFGHTFPLCLERGGDLVSQDISNFRSGSTSFGVSGAQRSRVPSQPTKRRWYYSQDLRARFSGATALAAAGAWDILTGQHF